MVETINFFGLVSIYKTEVGENMQLYVLTGQNFGFLTKDTDDDFNKLKEMLKPYMVYYSPVNLCIKRKIIPNKGIPLPRCSARSPETPPKFAAPPDVEKCHFRATPIWIVGKFRDL